MKYGFITSQYLFHSELIHCISYAYINFNSMCKTKVIYKLLTWQNSCFSAATLK